MGRSPSEYLEWKVRGWVAYRGRTRRGPVRAAPDDPGIDAAVARTLRLIGYLAALLLPFVVAGSLVPLRETITNTNAALVLVVVIVVVAIVGGPGPGAVAALAAAAAFDLLLTRPYYRPVIHAADDVEAAALLLLVGLLVGQIVAKEVRSRARAAGRRRELDHLQAVLDAASQARTADGVARAVEARLTDLLGLETCRWAPGYHGQAHAVLIRTGQLRSTTPLPADLGKLPRRGVELPVEYHGAELGRLVLTPGANRAVSLEERLTAVAVADAFGLALVALERRPSLEATPGPTNGSDR